MFLRYCGGVTFECCATDPTEYKWGLFFFLFLNSKNAVTAVRCIKRKCREQHRGVILSRTSLVGFEPLSQRATSVSKSRRDDAAICDCLAKVDVQHVRVAFAKTWMRNSVAASECRALFCSVCSQQKSLALLKKKTKIVANMNLFSRKPKEETDTCADKGEKDLFMCLSCAACFCSVHVRNHEEESARKMEGPDGSFLKGHSRFFGVLGGPQTPGRYGTFGKNKTLFPAFSLNESDFRRKDSSLSLEEEESLLFVQCSEPRDWSFNLWCTCCSGKPMTFYGFDYTETRHAHVRVRQLGDMLARMLYLFYLGKRIEPSKGDVGSTQTATHLGESLPRVRSVMDVHFHRSSQMDGNGHANHNVLTGTSSALVRGVKGELEHIAAAHIAGIVNTRNTCYFNSILQCVLKCKLFTQPLLSLGDGDFPGPLTRRLCAMIRHLSEETVEDLQTHAVYPLARAVLRQVCEISPIFAEDEQQDCQELFLSMINGVADEFDKGKTEEQKKQGPRISFEGVMRTEVVCQRCGSQFPREEVFMALSVPIKDSIESGLQELFRPMHLQGKDQYACEACFKKLPKSEQERHNAMVNAQNAKKDKEKAKAKKRTMTAEEKRSLNCVYSDAVVSTSISRLGGTLALHLLRFYCESRDSQKVTRAVSFPMSLDLTPFVSKDVLKEHSRTRSFSALSARFPNLQQNVLDHYLDAAGCDLAVAEQFLTEAGESERGELGPSSPNPASNDSVPLDDVRPTTEGRSAGTVSLTTHAATPNGGTKLPGSPPALKRDLVGIVTHRGSLHGGHYIAFVRDPQNSNYWFRCDDEEVDRVDKEFVLRCQSEVYMLFYE